MKVVYLKINPLVDSNGMVKVKAAVNGQGKLFSGMNVRVSVKRSLGSSWSFLKRLESLRSSKQVVFTFKRRQGNVELCTYGIGECYGICCLG